MELNLFSFHARFPDEEACYAYIIKRRWPNGLACLSCGSIEIYKCKTRRMFKCKDCRRQFSPLVDTIFQDTHLPLLKWFMTVYLLTSDGISSNQLAQKIGVTQKTAWFLLQKIMLAMEQKDIILTGAVQIDETYVGPKARGRTSARYSRKYAIIGAVETRPYGRMVLEVVKQPDATVAMEFIRQHIKPGTVIYTDESRIYSNLRYQYEHATVNHSQRQYVVNGITSNKIENSWMHTKRMLRGHHIWVSGKHLSTYAGGGHQFRYNTRGMGASKRFEAWFDQAWGKVLTYRQLLAKRATEPLALRGWARKRSLLPTQLSLGL